MSQNLDYCDLWHDLYEWALGHAKGVAEIMEEMDPRLVEEEEMAKQVLEAVKIFLKP